MSETGALGTLGTEGKNARSTRLDTMCALEIVTLMNEEDRAVPLAVEKALPRIADAVDLIVAALRRGGRLIYAGAGTSGRLAILDASECPPTFGVGGDVVKVAMAGGEKAVLHAVEGAEDSPEGGAEELKKLDISSSDVVVGVSASGRTPFVKGALDYARAIGASTVSLACNHEAEISRIAHVAIEAPVGAEVLTGSTRLKAGTAQKMVLNMLSTASFVRLGKAYGNLMIDVKPTNEKLVDRACRILMEASGAPRDDAEAALRAAGMQTKVALVMLKTGLGAKDAKARLDEAGGYAGRAIDGEG